MELTIPYKFKPRKYQLHVLKALDSGCRRAITIWHRRAGKDKVAFNYMIKRAWKEVGNYYYFLPTASLAKQVIWDNIDNDGFKTIDHIPKEIIKSKNDTEMVVDLKNGSTIKLIGSDKFEKRAVGTNPRGVVFSEYSISEPQVWDYVRPIVSINKEAWVLFNFTPRGVNHAHKLLQIAKNNPDTWFSEVLTIHDTGILNDEDVEQEIREGMPRELAQQEYYCKFLEGGTQFFKGVTDCVYEWEKHKHRLAPDKTKKYRLGIDLAKTQDFTCIRPFDLHTFKALKGERFNQIDWNLQKAKIEAEYLKYNKANIKLDSTGVGSPIFDDLVNRGIGNIEPIHFTEQIRTDLLNNLRILLEQRKIGIPDDPILIGELQSMQYELSDRGKTKIVVPSGLHDDEIFALALAVWELPNQPKAIQKSGLSAMLGNTGETNIAITEYN